MADQANHEQLSILLKHVDSSNTILTKFMDFCRCYSTTGEAIADQIIGQLRDWNIPLHNCKSQTYDGAGNMSGSQRGVAARIKAFNNKVICTHCASHKFNVATVKALKYPNIRNMMYTADKIVRFYNNSPKKTS